MSTFTGTDDDALYLVLGDSQKTTHWKPRELTWGQLVKAFVAPHSAAKGGAGGYVPVRLVPTVRKQDKVCRIDAAGWDAEYGSGEVLTGHVGMHRYIEAVEAACLITLDNDGATPDFIDRLRAFGVAGLAHPSHSHDPDAGVWKCRVLLRVCREMTADEKRLVTKGVMAEFPDQVWDPTCPSPEHLMYLPTRAVGAPYELTVLTGDLLDVDLWVIVGDLIERREAVRERPAVVPADLGVPATDAERAAALVELEDAADYLRGRSENRTPFMFGALRRRLYPYVMGGCLDRDQVDDVMRAAYVDAGQTADHYDEQMDNAWALAELEAGPLRPDVRPDLDDVFGVVPDDRPRLSASEEHRLIVRMFAWAEAQPETKRKRSLRWAAKKCVAEGADAARVHHVYEQMIEDNDE